LLSNATQLANSLEKTVRLFEHDIVINITDTTLISEGLGASVDWDSENEAYRVTDPVSKGNIEDSHEITEGNRVSVALSAAEQLVKRLSEDAAIYGVIPGPIVTATDLTGHDDVINEVRQPVTVGMGKLARAYGRLGVDGLLILEDCSGVEQSSEVIRYERDALETTSNIADHYRLPVVFSSSNIIMKAVPEISNYVDAVLLELDDPSSLSLEKTSIGTGLTPALLSKNPDEIYSEVKSMYQQYSTEGHFIASAREIPQDTHPNKLHAVVEAVDDCTG
jgi:uroporphyrinogen-III decarboxylase